MTIVEEKKEIFELLVRHNSLRFIELAVDTPPISCSVLCCTANITKTADVKSVVMAVIMIMMRERFNTNARMTEDCIIEACPARYTATYPTSISHDQPQRSLLPSQIAIHRLPASPDRISLPLPPQPSVSATTKWLRRELHKYTTRVEYARVHVDIQDSPQASVPNLLDLFLLKCKLG